MFDKSRFDEWAGSYDERIASSLHSFPFCGYYDVLAAVMSLADTRPGMRVLDVGIGTGLLSEAFSRQGCAIHGVDFSAEMLKQARTRIPDARLEAVDVAHDYLGGFREHQFDVIVSSYFLHHLDFEAQTSFLKRAVRDNLAPDGKIIVADVGFQSETAYESAHRTYAAAWDEDECYLCGDRIVAALNAEGIRAEYTQISECAGVLRCFAQPD